MAGQDMSSYGWFGNTDRDEYVANHLAVGMSAGTDGMDVDVSLPLTRRFSVRGGLGTMAVFPFLKYRKTVRVDTDSAWKIHDNVSGTARPTMGNAHLQVDYYPLATSSLHFSAGGYFLLNQRGMVHIRTDRPLPIQAGDYATTSPKIISADGSQVFVTTDTEGYLQADIKPAVGRLLPYAGVGFGRSVSDGKVRFLLDLGFLITGSYRINTYDYGIEGTAESPRTVPLTTEMFPQKYSSIAGKYRLIQHLPVYPVFRYSVFVKLF